MKLHLACGDIYLQGYINVDRVGCLVDDTSIDYYPTDLAHYYQNRTIGEPRAIWIDRLIDLERFPWPFSDGSVAEIVMIQAIEHFAPAAANEIVREIKRVLTTGGRLLIDFPDTAETIRQLADFQPALAMRYVYGSERNRHLWGYTRESFRLLLGAGWRQIEFREIVHHDYPVIGCEAIRSEDRVGGD